MKKKIQVSRLWLFLVAADFAAVAAAYYTTLLLRFHSGWGSVLFTRLNRVLGVRATGELGEPLEIFYQASAFRIIVLLTLTLGLLYALRDLYPGLRYLRARPLGWNVLVANVTALGLFYGYFYLSRNVFHPRSFFFTVLLLNVFYCIAFRAVTNRWVQWLREQRRMARCGAIVVGGGREADWICTLLQQVNPHGIHVLARWVPPCGERFDALLEKTEHLVRTRKADMVIMADPGLNIGQIMRLLELSDRLDVSTKILSAHLEVLVDRARQAADTVYGLPLVHFEAPSQVAKTVPWRRAVSVILALCGALLLLPVMLAVALLISLTSRGPALFVQERIGVNRRPFRMFKFRTMYDKAEEQMAQMEEFNESGGGLFKVKRDPRITPVGRFLRRFSLDEFPQLLNVLLWLTKSSRLQEVLQEERLWGFLHQVK